MSRAAVRRQRQLKRRIGRGRSDLLFAYVVAGNGKYYAVYRYAGLYELQVSMRLFIYWLERNPDYSVQADDQLYLHRKARLSDISDLMKYFDGIVPTVTLVPQQ